MGEVILAPLACLISVVPPELLLEAFYTLSAIHRVEGPRSDPPALALRAVCRYWRDIVDASPLLWDVIPLYSEGLADLFLSRAESVPIALFLRSLNRPAFNDSLSTGAFRLAFADMSRVSELSVFGWPSFGHPANWRKIQAQLEQVQMPRLHTLQIRAATIPDFLFCGTTPPNLRILCADSDGLAERGIFARGLIPLLHAPLTTLELHKIPVSDASQMIVIEALERLISLRILHLRFADRRHRTLQSQRAPRSVSLPVLEEASFDLDLRDLCTFVGVLGMPTGVNLTLSWSSSQSLPLGVALSHIGDVKGLLQAHLASLIAQGLQFGCMTSTIVHPVLGNGRRLLKLTSPTLTNPSCVSSFLPSEINIRYAYWWIERESMIRSADFINDYFAFKALLYALPGLSSSHTLHIDDNSSSPARLSSLFAIMPRVKTIIINNTCIHNILIGLSNAMRSQTLSALRTLDLRRLTLTDLAPRDVIGGPQVTAGEALVHLLDALVASGVKPISIQMRYCLVAEETVEALRARLSSGIIIG